MMSLANSIRKLGAGAVDANYPVAVMYGTVTKINPLEVNVDQRFTIEEECLIVPEQMTKFEIDLKHKHDTTGVPTQYALTEKVVIREGLKAGDAVLLLRVQGGQKFVVWDRVKS